MSKTVKLTMQTSRHNLSWTERTKVRGQRSTSSPSTVEWDVPVTVCIPFNGAVLERCRLLVRGQVYTLELLLCTSVDFVDGRCSHADCSVSNYFKTFMWFSCTAFLREFLFLGAYEKHSKLMYRPKNNFASVGKSTFCMWGPAVSVSYSLCSKACQSASWPLSPGAIL